jgi:hypothetical protein
MSCYAVGDPKKRIPGGAAITVLQLLLIVGAIFVHVALLLVALVLAVVASATRKQVCGTCGAATLVPTDSPRGAEVMARRQAQQLTP